MKLTYHWLQDHLDTRLSPGEIASRLTMAGLEVEAVVDLGAPLDKVQVGLLETVDPHPNADRLTLCRVRVGEERLTIVCGATNHRPGDRVAVARVGAQLPNGLTIRQGKIRGETSQGMLCSAQELGLASQSDGILILPADAQPGVPVARILGREDTLFEVNVTPNRGDCLGVRGIARDLAAVLEADLRPLAPRVAVDPAVAQRHPVAVLLEDPEGCPRYTGRVIEGVRVAPSPDWLRHRLEAVGLRSINNVVDVTNLLLLDLGQPLHAFDLDRLQPPVVVRRAWAGERLLTLDGMERPLTGAMTLIADAQRPLALGGIMGGAASGVTEATVTLFLESACFDPIRIARTGRQLSIVSDSRYRFERGVDPDGVGPALDRATELILALAGGRAGPVVVAESGALVQPAPIPFRHQRAIRLAGVQLSPEQTHGMLTRLGCQAVEVPGAGDGATRHYRPPSFRQDLRLEEDLIEEIVRLYGYDRVPSRMPEGPVDAQETDPARALADQVRSLLTGRGYLETINFAFVAAQRVRAFQPEVRPVALVNPLSEDQGVLRTLLTPGLMEAAQRNLSRGNTQLRLFELGRIFLPQEGGPPTESEHLAALLSGPLAARSWNRPDRAVDFFDLKGDLEAVWSGLRLPPATFRPGGPGFLHPGRKADILLGGESCGWIGQLHPSRQEAFDLAQPLLLLELELAPLVAARERGRCAPFISRFPAVARDFAFVVDDGLPAEELLNAIRQTERPLIRRVGLFDLYTGPHVPDGKKSLGVEVVFQSADRTLTDAEVQGLADAITSAIQQQFQATLRGG
ncbi:MAG: phenylalanine--tRNA ligase subunit beta [Magnetococcales bacterium]|nr:phenylalanine--tRNA ligase subunit beta [Magnetococcales bacterium]